MKRITDEFGGIYSADRKTLLHCPNVESYRVAEGTVHLDKNAFPYYTREGNTFVFNHELLNDPEFSPF